MGKKVKQLFLIKFNHMGNDETTLRHKDFNRIQKTNFLEITAQHNKKLYHKNLKPFKQFHSIIQSIHLRVAYLNYEWAVYLCSQLATNAQKVYKQYCEDFKLCILKQSQNTQYFQPKCLSEKFFFSLQQTKDKLQKFNFSNSELETLFEEVKCFFMVQNWFQELSLNNPGLYINATLGSYQTYKENINTKKSPQFLTSKKDLPTEIDCQRQKIYSILLKLTQSFYDNHYSFKRKLQNSDQQSQSPKMNPIKRFTTKQGSLIKLIAREPNFRQRQIYIELLLNLLFKQKQNETFPVQQNKVTALLQILGLKRVYCVLRILSEVGEIQQINQVNILFSLILEKLQLKNKQINKSQNIFEVRQSPSKKPESKNEVKFESIR